MSLRAQIKPIVQIKPIDDSRLINRLIASKLI